MISPEQFEELKRLIKDTIHKEVSAIVTDKFTTTLKKLDEISEDINSGFKDMGEDRKDMAIIKTSQATVERLTKELLDIIETQTQRLANSVEHSSKQAIENSTQAIVDKVEPAVERLAKKITNGVPLGKSRKWYFLGLK